MDELLDFNYDYMKFQYGKGHLSDIFMTMVDNFPHIQDAHVIGQHNLWELLQKIKYNIADDVAFEPILNPKYLNGRKNPKYDENKKRLPAVCYNANFNAYKDLSHLLSPTNLMFLDIDDFNSKEEALEYKNIITLRYDWIVACNLSLSRLGLHIIIQVDKIIDNDDYNNKYDFISQSYFNGKLDKNGKSLTRYTIVPFDFNIYINESPNVLNIEHIIKSDENGIRSGYIEKTVISTAYTFSSASQLNPILNESARLDGLVFKQCLDESIFLSPDIPIYIPEGMDVIKFNARPYHDRKVKDGNRTFTIGGLTIRLIYLNAKLLERKDTKVKEAILKCMVGINKEICDPPLPYKEVLNSFNANWKKYEADELDFSKYYVKQRSFWSRECTLKGNEKRKITCKKKNEPIVAKSKSKIKTAVEALKAQGVRLTQKKVAEESGLQLPTVKKYRDYYNELINSGKKNLKQNWAVTDFIIKPDSQILLDTNDITELNLPVQNSSKSDTLNESKHYMKIENPEIIDCDEDTLVMFDELEFKITDEQIREVYDRIFSSFRSKLDEHQEQVLHRIFIEQLNKFTHEDVKFIAVNIEDINDSTTYFKQSDLDSKLMDLCYKIFGEGVSR